MPHLSPRNSCAGRPCDRDVLRLGTHEDRPRQLICRMAHEDISRHGVLYWLRSTQLRRTFLRSVFMKEVHLRAYLQRGTEPIRQVEEAARACRASGASGLLTKFSNQRGQSCREAVLMNCLQSEPVASTSALHLERRCSRLATWVPGKVS